MQLRSLVEMRFGRVRGKFWSNVPASTLQALLIALCLCSHPLTARGVEGGAETGVATSREEACKFATDAANLMMKANVPFGMGYEGKVETCACTQQQTLWHCVSTWSMHLKKGDSDWKPLPAPQK